MTGDVGEEVTHIRQGGVGLWLSERGLIEVTGGDASRWLDGMVSNDITQLAPGGASSGCYATLLTPKGRIVADLHVLARGEGYWLETAPDAVARVTARLERYIIADDVKLTDRSEDFESVGVEGAAAAQLLVRASGEAVDGLARGSWLALEVGGVTVTAARFGWSGEDAFQLLAPRGSGSAAVSALLAAAGDIDAAECSPAALEVLRIEAGVPLLGPELDEEVFPDEARLSEAISRTKGCYTGQEIVARLYSRGAVNHLLVGLSFEADEPPAPDTVLVVDGRTTGEVTSACTSPSAGAIGLGYVRCEHAEPGTEVTAGDVRARVAALPIVPPATPEAAGG